MTMIAYTPKLEQTVNRFDQASTQFCFAHAPNEIFLSMTHLDRSLTREVSCGRLKLKATRCDLGVLDTEPLGVNGLLLARVDLFAGDLAIREGIDEARHTVQSTPLSLADLVHACAIPC